jgi:MoxR-like ATPase
MIFDPARVPEYIFTEELVEVVRAALILEKPLLIRGEPGTGKTQLGFAIAKALGIRLIYWPIKSTTTARDGLYIYDTLRRLNDARFGGGDVQNIRNYIRLGPLGEALASSERVLLLIDEIDKAEPEFPNDLLYELDAMEFRIEETGETIRSRHRPIVVITSNAERDLPEPFLRRCVFHYLPFPTPELMERIVQAHLPDLSPRLVTTAITTFFQLRKMPGLRKPPSTAELLDWLRVLVSQGIKPEDLETKIPYLGVLLKKPEDLDLIEGREEPSPALPETLRSYWAPSSFRR